MSRYRVIVELLEYPIDGEAFELRRKGELSPDLSEEDARALYEAMVSVKVRIDGEGAP